MTTPKILKTDRALPTENLIALTAEILKNGGIIVAPSETRYGLLGRVDNVQTVSRLYDLKQRPETMATAIFIRSRNDISQFAFETKISKKLADDFLPGPLTLILKNKSGYQPPIVIKNKIGIRCSSSVFIEKILSAIDFNLTATSANISGGDEPETIDEILDSFGADVDLYIDSGRLNSPPSTVVECLDDNYLILRAGAITEKRINEKVAGI